MKNRDIPHYAGFIEPIDFITQNGIGFCEGNIIKYTFRHSRKNGADDLMKVIDYARLLIKSKYPESYQSVCKEASELFKTGGTMPATERMIEFASDIAEELNINEPDYDDFEETSEFISENKGAYYDSVNGVD